MYNKPYKKRRRRAPVFLLFFVVMLLLLGGVVMLLWNTILPQLIGTNQITYLQSLGLLILCRILFGGFRFGPPGRPPFNSGNPWRNKWMGMSEEEKAKFRSEWQKRCGVRKEPPGGAGDEKKEE